MANPQVENGYTKIANELLEAFTRTNLSSYQFRIVAAILRKTYGWQRKDGFITVTQLAKITGISKGHVSRTKKELIGRKIVTSLGNKIALNKDYTQWTELPRQVTVTSSGNKSYLDRYQKLPGQEPSTIFIKEKKKEKRKERGTPLCPHSEIQKLYHKKLPMLPKIVQWNKERQAALRARWQEHPSIEWWEAYFDRVRGTPFLLGDNKRGWKASIDFLLRPSSKGMTGILEGKYESEKDKYDIPKEGFTI